ncbi:UNVERIFIED_ORG: DNA-N1-methyladenine dioxygenase [Martelella mediterranea]
MSADKPGLPEGFRYLPDYLDRAAQAALVEDIRTVVAEAPLYVPAMPRTGKPMSVRMTNCGPLGWVTDKERGYRYQATHPVTGRPWPPMPERLMALWRDLAGYREPPEACLINFYDDTAKMGMHQDSDEADFSAPVLSISLGDTCLFRVGGTDRKDKAVSLKLASGDIVLLAGKSRLAYHGVTRTYPGTSTLLKNGGRINLTMRRVSSPSL